MVVQVQLLHKLHGCPGLFLATPRNLGRFSPVSLNQKLGGWVGIEINCGFAQDSGGLCGGSYRTTLLNLDVLLSPVLN